MKRRIFISLIFWLILSMLAGCMTKPSFINDEDPLEDTNGLNTSPVNFRGSKEFRHSPPECIAILPLKSDLKHAPQNQTPASEEIRTLSSQQLKKLRRILYSHLAPFPIKDIELSKVDAVIGNRLISKYDYQSLGESLDCDALLVGRITDYNTEFLGFYSKISVGAKLMLIRAKDGHILWEGRHVATSHDGSLPITPVDFVLGIYHASTNIEEEQVVRVTDDLFRRLFSTWGVIDTISPEIKLAKKEPVKKINGSYKVTSQKLVLRAGPGKQYTAKSMLYKNDTVLMIDKNNPLWTMVKTSNGHRGYVYGKYISEIETSIKQVNQTQKESIVAR